MGPQTCSMHRLHSQHTNPPLSPEEIRIAVFALLLARAGASRILRLLLLPGKPCVPPFSFNYLLEPTSMALTPSQHPLPMACASPTSSLGRKTSLPSVTLVSLILPGMPQLLNAYTQLKFKGHKFIPSAMISGNRILAGDEAIKVES